MGPWRHLSSFPVATSASDTQQNSINMFLSLVWWNGSGYFPWRLLALKFLANSSNRDVAMGDSLKVYPRDLSQNSLRTEIESGSLCCNYCFSFPFHHPNVLNVYLFVYMCFLQNVYCSVYILLICINDIKLCLSFWVTSSPLSPAFNIHPYCCGFI